MNPIALLDKERELDLELERMALKANKDTVRLDSSDDVKIVRDDTPQQVDTELDLWLERYARVANGKTKNMAIATNYSKDNVLLLEAYDREFGGVPKHTHIEIPAFNEIANEILRLEAEEKDMDLEVEQAKERITEATERIRKIQANIEHTKAIPVQSNTQRKKRDDTLKYLNIGKDRHMEIINGAHQEIETLQRDMRLKQSEVAFQKSKKKDAISSYEEAQKAFNTKVFQTSRFPNEDEEQYIQRMKDNEELEDVRAKTFDAKRLIESRFKDNMNELFRRPTMVLGINNTIEEQSMGEDPSSIIVRYQINENWPKFKLEFQTLYGKDPKMSVRTFNDFVAEFLKNPEAAAVPPASSVDISDDSLKIEREGRTCYFGHKGKYVLWSSSGHHGDWNEYTSLKIDKITEKTGITRAEIKELFMGTVSVKGIQADLYKRGVQPLNYALLRIIRPDGRIEIGAGLKGSGGIRVSDSPAIVPFGRLNLFLNRLLTHNILKVKCNEACVTGFPNRHVSDRFVKTIEYMLKHKQVDKEDFERLEPEEQGLFNHLIERANLSKKVGAGRLPVNLLKDLEIIKGEIEVGNNNPMLLREATHILQELFKYGTIDWKERKDYLDELKRSLRLA